MWAWAIGTKAGRTVVVVLLCVAAFAGWSLLMRHDGEKVQQAADSQRNMKSEKVRNAVDQDVARHPPSVNRQRLRGWARN